MGRLSDGKPLRWTEITEEIAKEFKDQACEKFIAHFNGEEDENKPVLWGEEIEYYFIAIRNDGAKLLLRAEQYIPRLDPSLFHWETILCQLESTPAEPYGPEDVTGIESGLRERKRMLRKLLEEGEDVITLSVWPRYACEGFTEPQIHSDKLVPNEILTPTDRYQCLYGNLYHRGMGPMVSLPVFRDEKTSTQTLSIKSYGVCTSPCALQITIQAKDLTEARYLYDQMAVMVPFLTALSAAAPAFKGLLLDTDSRLVLQCGTRQNRDEETTGLPTRWSSVRHYISDRGTAFNDVRHPVDEVYYKRLREAGIAEGLARHTAFRLQYDPIVMYENNDKIDAAECMNGTVWELVKLKVPEDEAGWRIEVRPMDISPYDSQNAALLIFVFLLSRTMLHYDLDFLIQMSKLSENVDKSLKRDAVLKGRFVFRCSSSEVDFPEQMLTMDEIFNGCASFPGLIDYVIGYVKTQYKDDDCPPIDGKSKENRNELRRVLKYLDLISKLASGEEPTTARKVRDFVVNHESYEKDSVVSESILTELVKELLLD